MRVKNSQTYRERMVYILHIPASPRLWIDIPSRFNLYSKLSLDSMKLLCKTATMYVGPEKSREKTPSMQNICSLSGGCALGTNIRNS